VEKCGEARQATADNIIRCMRFTCWMTKATNTLRICNTYCFSTARMVTGTRLNITFTRTLPVLFRTAYTLQLMLNINIFAYVKHDDDLSY
jgi:hypothetical protein